MILKFHTITNKSQALLRQPGLVTVITLAILAMQNNAFAEAAISSSNFNKRFFIGANIGASQLQPKTENTAFSLGEDASVGGSLLFGMDFNKYLSFEAFVSDLGHAQLDRVSDGTSAGNIDYQYFGLSGIGYLFNSRGGKGLNSREGLSGYLRLGGGQVHNSADPAINFKLKNETPVHIGGGFEYGWSNGFAARAEFYSFDKDAKMVSLGLVKRFGEAYAPPPGKVPTITPELVKVLPPPELLPVQPEPISETRATPEVSRLNIEMPTVFFPFNEHYLTEKAKIKLEKMAETLKENSNLKVKILGHTDSTGEESYNVNLGKNRASTVTRYLISQGVPLRQLRPQSYGEAKPIARNDKEPGKALNRRVEFSIR